MADPAGVPGLLHRWRADSIAQAEGSAVATWPALAGGTSFAQISSAAQPTYRTGVLNGHPVVRFDGTNDLMNAPIAAIAQPITVVMVVRLAAVGGQRQLFLSLTSQAWSNGTPWAINFGGASLTGGVCDTDWHVVTIVMNGASTAVYDNGAQIIAGNAGAEGLESRFQIGQFSTGRNLNGDIAEIIGYGRALSAAERATVHSYVQDTYGIAVGDYVGGTAGRVADRWSGSALVRQQSGRWTGTALVPQVRGL